MIGFVLIIVILIVIFLLLVFTTSYGDEKVNSVCFILCIVLSVVSFTHGEYYSGGSAADLNSNRVTAGQVYEILGTGKTNTKEWWVTLKEINQSEIYTFIANQEPAPAGQKVIVKLLESGDLVHEVALIPYQDPPKPVPYHSPDQPVELEKS